MKLITKNIPKHLRDTKIVCASDKFNCSYSFGSEIPIGKIKIQISRHYGQSKMNPVGKFFYPQGHLIASQDEYRVLLLNGYGEPYFKKYFYWSNYKKQDDDTAL